MIKYCLISRFRRGEGGVELCVLLSESLSTCDNLDHIHRCRRQGGWGAAALPTLEKFAKISNNRAENRPKVGQNLGKQWIFYRAAPLNFTSPYAYDHIVCLYTLYSLRPYSMQYSCLFISSKPTGLYLSWDK